MSHYAFLVLLLVLGSDTLYGDNVSGTPDLTTAPTPHVTTGNTVPTAAPTARSTTGTTDPAPVTTGATTVPPPVPANGTTAAPPPAPTPAPTNGTTPPPPPAPTPAPTNGTTAPPPAPTPAPTNGTTAPPPAPTPAPTNGTTAPPPAPTPAPTNGTTPAPTTAPTNGTTAPPPPAPTTAPTNGTTAPPPPAPTTTPTNVTTAAPPAPTTVAPSPMPPPSVGNYSILSAENGSVCLMATMGLQIGYKVGEVFKSVNLVPANTTASGKCEVNGSDASLVLTFDKSSISFSFREEGAKFRLHAVNVLLSLGTTGTFNASNANLSLWEASVGSSYMCRRDQAYNITDVLILHTRDLRVQPYKVQNNSYATAEECFLDSDLTFLVPIAVGVALSFLIVLVLISYLIGRRKSRTGYQSV